MVEEVYDRIAARGDDAVWIHVVPREEALAAARDLARRFPGPDLPPLYGLPFAVKDNIDVAGLPTTAACPEFAYVAGETAPVVRRALDAGAVLVGKTNLDQFATGLSGTRSPYGIVRNPHDARRHRRRLELGLRRRRRRRPGDVRDRDRHGRFGPGARRPHGHGRA